MPIRWILVPALILVVLGNIAIGQAPGFRMFGMNGSDTTQLVDVNDVVVHSWTASSGGASYYVVDDGTLMRTYTPAAAPTGYPGGAKGGVERVALDGSILWSYEHIGPGFRAHHDIAPLPNGNVLMISWDEWTPAEAIAAGRSSSLMLGPVFRPEYVIEVQPTGPTTSTIVWEWHLGDHLIQDQNPGQANFGVVSANPGLADINYPPVANQANDWIHMNSIDYDPVNDWILLSAPRMDEIWVIDHSTTTAEAAGHTGGARGMGGDLLYRWGNPAAYQQGVLADQQLSVQHGSNFIKPGHPGAGNIIVFNNQVPGDSEVWELVLPFDASGNFIMNAGGTFDPVAPIWTYGAPGFNSNFLSNAERLPNGNTLICSGAQGTVFEVTTAGATVWTHSQAGTIFQAHYVDRTLWADSETMSATAGGTIDFSLISGTPHAGSTYWVVGSATGTSPGIVHSGMTLPLIYDDYTAYCVTNANSSILTETFGTLDGMGRATASFNLPGGLLPPSIAGFVLYHAFAVISGSVVTATSNAVPLTFLP